MTNLARIEVTEMDDSRPRTTVVYFPTVVQPASVERLRPVVDVAVARLGAALNLTRGNAALFLAGEVAKLHADAEAYERESARRGVLAL